MFQAAPAANVSAPPLNSGGFDKYSWVPRENKNSLQTSNKLREYFHWIRSECCPLGYGGLVGWLVDRPSCPCCCVCLLRVNFIPFEFSSQKCPLLVSPIHPFVLRQQENKRELIVAYQGDANKSSSSASASSGRGLNYYYGCCNRNHHHSHQQRLPVVKHAPTTTLIGCSVCLQINVHQFLHFLLLPPTRPPTRPG